MSDVWPWGQAERQAVVDEIVHGEDIRGRLGIAHAYVPEAVELAAGLTLRGTDLDLVVGSGPEVSGPVLALLMVSSGRARCGRLAERPR